jgi:CheY-like chemotaxis protein
MTEILNGKTLLIVEDEVDLREPLAAEFESFGCRVLQAANGREGFEILKREKIDAVISDIRMPGGDGIELLKNIKTLHHGFPVVMLITGFADLTREDAYDLGAEAILSKPFDLDEVDRVVVRILTAARQRWSQPPSDERVSVTIAREFPEVAAAVAGGELGLGRGGIFVTYAGQPTFQGDLVALRITFAAGPLRSIEGSGVVRWTRPQKEGDLPTGSGIEFERLAELSQDQVLQLTDHHQIKPFIPKSPKL